MAAEQPRIRHAIPAHAPSVIALLNDGFASYRDFAPPDWEPPDIGQEEELVFERFVARAEVWYEVAEDTQGHAGQCGFMPAHRRRNMQGDPVPGTAQFWQLFVRRDLWGGGLAGDLHARAVTAMRGRGYTRARLFTPAGQARARRFYEKRGWREAPISIDDPPDLAGLAVVEYRLDLSGPGP